MVKEGDKTQIEIPLSKIKLTLLLFVALAFVIGGACFIINPSAFQDSGTYRRPKIEILIVGFACVIFFGTAVVIFAIKLFDKKPGLIINDQEIIINPGSFSSTAIEWNEIEGFAIASVYSTKLIVIFLKKPEEFISRFNSAFKRKMARFSLNSYGTPISISANSLKCNTNELHKLLTERLNNRSKNY